MNVIADFIGQIVQVFYAFTGDYGIAIVMITLAVKLLLLPLNIKQRAQLKKQKEVSQKVAEIQKKYANNQNRMNEELQKVYAENGLGSMGCLSTLIQMPIMIGLYHGIRNVITEDATSVLLPWISSLLLSDVTGILPIGTLVLQVLPMLFPYIPCFGKKQLQKTPIWLLIRSVMKMVVSYIKSTPLWKKFWDDIKPKPRYSCGYSRWYKWEEFLLKVSWVMIAVVYAVVVFTGTHWFMNYVV